MADTILPTAEQQQRARWDLLIADLECRQDQMHVARQDLRIKPGQLAISGMTAGAALFAAGAAFFKLMDG